MALDDYMKHVSGKDRGTIILYALSTCGWCRKTKALLKDLNIAYDYVDVDFLTMADREEAVRRIKEFNPAGSFPTLIVDNKVCVVGYKEDRIREVLGDGTE